MKLPKALKIVALRANIKLCILLNHEYFDVQASVLFVSLLNIALSFDLIKLASFANVLKRVFLWSGVNA